jgi:hypothetical protein
MYPNPCRHGVYATVSPKWRPNESLGKALPKEAGGEDFPSLKVRREQRNKRRIKGMGCSTEAD